MGTGAYAVVINSDLALGPGHGAAVPLVPAGGSGAAKFNDVYLSLAWASMLLANSPDQTIGLRIRIFGPNHEVLLDVVRNIPQGRTLVAHMVGPLARAQMALILLGADDGSQIPLVTALVEYTTPG